MGMSASSQQRHVICMKWGTKYGPKYVNRLYAMVKRHLTLDFQMVCLTDDMQGIHPQVRCLPVLPLGIHAPAGPACILAQGLVPEFQIRLHPGMADQFLD